MNIVVSIVAATHQRLHKDREDHAACKPLHMSINLHILADELGISLPSVQGRGMPEYEEATELELVEAGADGKEHFLSSRICYRLAV
jgi:hypothetical protein